MDLEGVASKDDVLEEKDDDKPLWVPVQTGSNSLLGALDDNLLEDSTKPETFSLAAGRVESPRNEKISRTPPSGVGSQRDIERLIWTPGNPQEVLVLLENDPSWMLSLRLSDWSHIWLPTDSYQRISNDFPEIVSHFGRRIQSTSMESLKSVGSQCLVALVSGSCSFVQHSVAFLADTLPVMAILVDASRSGRHGLSPAWKSWTYKHSQMGGVTTIRSTVAFRGIEPVRLRKFVSRNLGHIIKASIRPTSWRESMPDADYSPDDLLRATCLDGLIRYPTHMSYTGWGIRSLSTDELKEAFDFPLWCPWIPTMRTPIKMCLTLLEGFLGDAALQQPATPDSAPGPSAGLEPSRQVPPSESWIPSLQRTLPGAWADASFVQAKAAKADDAPVEYSMWDSRISLLFPSFTPPRLEKLRRIVQGWQYRRVYTEFRSYLVSRYGTKWNANLLRIRRNASSSKRPSRRYKGGGGLIKDDEGLLKDANGGTKALNHLFRSSWWEWTHGSALLFWRWCSRRQIEWARDGMPIYVSGELPTTKDKQRPPDTDEMEKIAKKLGKVLDREYVDWGEVMSLIEMFAVVKDVVDIRMVYNGTKSGLNDALWAPSFFMPNADSATRLLSYDTFCVDLDLGEMFLNFFMDEKIRPYAGIDLTAIKHLLKEAPDVAGRLEMRWNRQFMGMKPSPYNSVRSYYFAEEFARGNPRIDSNPMRYDKVILNLPGSPDYDPSQPRVMKWNNIAEAIAGDVVTFVDDLRASGYSFENAWQVARQIASRFQYLGIQDAPRKRRPSSQKPGAWAGALFRIHPDEITKSVTQEKWDKARQILAELLAKCFDSEDSRPELNHKDLERKVGFLIHLGMTFDSFIPFLKEIYLTLNSWRTKRDENGWKMSDKRWLQFLSSQLEDGNITEEEMRSSADDDKAPKTVKATPGFRKAMEALNVLSDSETAPEIRVRSKHILYAIYGVGDASGKGFGSAIGLPGTPNLSIRIGVWGTREASDNSSNWREFTNVVEALEEEAAAGRLADTEVYFCTDNSTVESAIYSGTSSSAKLLDLVIRFKALQTKYSVNAIVLHVAGTRMIACGGDGVSRGNTNEGVMSGATLLSFIPLHLTAIERAPELEIWLKNWLGPDSSVLKPIDWFERGHDITGWKMCSDNFWRPTFEQGKYIWVPPPGAAGVAIEELRKARIKRQESTHVFVVPRLLTKEWLRQLYKAADFVFEVPISSSVWGKEFHEPLLIGIVFPFIRANPWQLRSTPKMFATGRQLSRLWEDESLDECDFLRKFCVECWRLESLPEHVVRKVLLIKQGVKLLRRGRGATSQRADRRRSLVLPVASEGG